MSVRTELEDHEKSAIFELGMLLSDLDLPEDEQLVRLIDELTELATLIGPSFARTEPRHQAMRYVMALLSKGGRKNSWRIAKLAGDMSPWRTQRLLNRARWNADSVRDAVRNYVVAYLEEPSGVLAIDEIGVIKKGSNSVAVARQYTETTGRVENCQIGLFATYVSSRGCAVIDHELYLPKVWTDDLQRCRKAGVPPDRMVARTKQELSRKMIQRYRAANLPVGWVAGGVEYGRDKLFRAWLESNRINYVLTVPGSQPVATPFGIEVPTSSFAIGIASNGWNQYRDGGGAAEGGGCGRPPGRKISEWARIDVTMRRNDLVRDPGPAPGFARTLLIQRRPGSPQSTFYLAHAPKFSSLDALVAAAQAQQAARTCLRTAQEQVGMDEYEVRNWTAWHRHIALAGVAHAALVASNCRRHPQPHPGRSAPLGAS